MEPLSAAGAILSALDVLLRTTSALASWAQNTRHAAAERALVAKEASLLASLLERIRSRVGTGQDEKWLSDRSELVSQFQTAFKDLCRVVKIDPASGQPTQESRLKAAITSSRWAFTKSESFSVLERITRLQQCANALSLDHQGSLLEHISETQQDAIKDKLRLSVLEWLSSLQVNRLLFNTSERAVEGSGKWFLSSDIFHAWESGKKRLLWGWGIPGSGKTTLVAIIADYLQQQRASQLDEKQSGIAVLYLKYNDREQTLENLLASLCKQLLQAQQTVPPYLVELYEKYTGQNQFATAEELFEALSSTAASCGSAYILVDGLDECMEELRWPLVETLLKVPSHVRVMLTSRFLDSMDEDFNQFRQLEIKANREDIELFIDSQVKKNRNLRKMIQKHQAMRDEIKAKVVESAQGMFLLARLHVESLVGAAALSVKHVRKKLDSLPTTLNGTYDEAMNRVNGQEEDHKAIAIRSLAWVSYAFRPLLLRELQHAVEIESDSVDLDEDALVEGHSIIALCAGLVVIDQNTSEVNLVHYTAKKYFEEVRHEVFPGFHATITLSCATYLNLDVLKNAHVRDIVQWYPLARYAVQYMAEHARVHPEETLESSTLEIICQLFSRPDKRKPLLALLDGLDLINAGFYSSRDSRMRDSTSFGITSDDLESLDRSPTMRTDRTLIESGDAGDGDGDGEGDTETATNHPDIWTSPIGGSQGPEVTALHLAASMGLAKVSSMLLRGTLNVDAPDENGNTALVVAMNRGFEKAVEFLIESGACVNLEDEHGRATLLLAAERKWSRVGDVILQKYKNIPVTEKAGHPRDLIDTILSVYEGDINRLRALAATGTLDLRAKDRDLGEYLLFLCVERSQLPLVAELVSLGVDINAQDGAGQTSLHRATRRMDHTAMKTLLQCGIDIDRKNDAGQSAFTANIWSREEHTLRILLEAGADPNIKGHNGTSEMYLAGSGGRVDQVRFLLRLGMDPSTTTDFGWAPLHWASASAHIETVNVLLEAGADPSPVSDQDTTPLDLAVQSGDEEVIQALRKWGALQRKDIETDSKLLSEMERLRMAHAGEGWVEISKEEPERASGDGRDRTVFVFDEPLRQNLHHGQFIYEPTTSISDGSKPIVYNIAIPIDKPSTTIVVGRLKSLGRPVMAAYYSEDGLDEYFRDTETVHRVFAKTANYQTLELRRDENSSLEDIIVMTRSWTGSWHIHERKEGANTPLFRTMPDLSPTNQKVTRWMTDSGLMLARCLDDISMPTIDLEPGTDDHLRDILISCWIARIWYGHQTDKTITVAK